MTLLEDLRGPKVGDIQLRFGSGEVIAAAFHDHAQQAEWHTINVLMRFAGNSAAVAANERIAVTEWWRTIESLVALLHVVAIAESESGLRQQMQRIDAQQRQDFQAKWSLITSWFSDRTSGVPKDLRRRVLALRDWRNSFEHASRGSVIEPSNSRLGVRPSDANLADVMEAMAICVEACSSLRYFARGLDLMPQIIAPSQQHVLFVPLDQLAAKLLFPVYHQTVQTVGLNTEVESYPSRNPGPGESIISLTPCMKAQPDQRDLACGVPLDLCGHFEKFTAGPANLPRSGHFNLPNYIRAKPKES